MSEVEQAPVPVAMDEAVVEEEKVEEKVEH
jgi:hypothetical protein